MQDKDGQASKPATPVAPVDYSSQALRQFMSLKSQIGPSLQRYQEGLRQRELAALQRGIGTWKPRAQNQLVLQRPLSCRAISCARFIGLVSIAYFFMLCFIHMLRPLACLNGLTIEFDMEEQHYVVLYTVPAIAHLLSIVWFLASFAYYKVCGIVITPIVDSDLGCDWGRDEPVAPPPAGAIRSLPGFLRGLGISAHLACRVLAEPNIVR